MIRWASTGPLYDMQRQPSQIGTSLAAAREPHLDRLRPMGMTLNLVVAILVLFVAGCAAGAPAASDGSPQAVRTDFGPPDSEWRLESGFGPDGKIPQRIASSMSLRLMGEFIEGHAACNSLVGTVAIKGTSFRAPDAGTGTEVGCAGIKGVAERRYVSALQAASTISRQGDSLILAGEDVELRFVLNTAPPKPPLEGTRWVLGAVLDGEGAGDFGAESRLVFRKDGTLDGSTGCRALKGDWTKQGAKVVASAKASGPWRCEDYQRPQDEHVLKVLNGTFDATITTSYRGVDLTLEHSLSAKGLSYHPAP